MKSTASILDRQAVAFIKNSRESRDLEGRSRKARQQAWRFEPRSPAQLRLPLTFAAFHPVR